MQWMQCIFQKAFDKVPDRRLLANVRAYEVAGTVANWMGNWLIDQKQSGCEWEDVKLWRTEVGSGGGERYGR